MNTRGMLWIGSRAIVWSMLLAGPCYTWPQWIDVEIPWLNFVRWPGSGYVEYTWSASNLTFDSEVPCTWVESWQWSLPGGVVQPGGEDQGWYSSRKVRYTALVGIMDGSRVLPAVTGLTAIVHGCMYSISIWR